MFLCREDLVSHNCIPENHLDKKQHRDLMSRHADKILVFDIERGLRDVIVSSYHDARNRSGFKGSFAEF